MQRLSRVALVIVSVVSLLSGCSLFEGGGTRRAAWRHEAEAQCIAAGRVHASDAITPIPEVDGRSGCGADHPFKIHAFANGTVALSETAELNCPTAAAMDDWLERVVQPNAQAMFGQPVVGLKLLGTYNCRSIARVSSMSEHSYMNAIDVGGFRFADGHDILIGRDWNTSDAIVHQFLRVVGEQSCLVFNTALGPDYNADHHDHFHLDLAARMHTHKRVCKAGCLKDGPALYPMPTFTSSVKPATPPFGTGEQPMPTAIPSSATGSITPSDLGSGSETMLHDDEIEDDD